ncbi:MAG: hypothetical protein H0U54_10745 [Acidobacteria bacterium]|nr:hypothetical protein [Acidobacteriota bacterium]
MDSKIAHDERVQFCRRLTASLISAGFQPSASALVKEFNPRADGAAVTVHGARKWLTGEAFPTQERLHILARWLNVSAQWLRYGDGVKDARTAANDGTQLSLDEVRLINEFRRLDERSQEVVRDLISSLIKHQSL